MDAAEMPPPGSKRVALAYSQENVNLSGRLTGGLKKAWEVIDSHIAWLCGEGEGQQENRPPRTKSGLLAKMGSSPGCQEEEVAVQHVLVAGCHSEILPVCTTPTCASIE